MIDGELMHMKHRKIIDNMRLNKMSLTNNIMEHFSDKEKHSFGQILAVVNYEQKRLIEGIKKNKIKGNTLTEKGFDRGLNFVIKLIEGK